MKSVARMGILCCVVLSLAAAPGCGPLRRGQAVPAELQDRAVVPGMGPGVRTWGSEVNAEATDLLRKSVEREEAALAAAGHTGPLPPAYFLAVSGGGSNGAFGAGLLCGWTEAGTRPSFKAVTGISTGALIAPFAYLGPAYDPVLREVYTRTRTRDILIERGLLAAISSDALSDTKPLWKTLSKHVDQKLLDAIAAENAKGRVLMIGTTNLDARRSVLWNIGEIAASGHPGALELVRKILIASASIPAAFPPVFIDVEVDGKKYQEMHVDGGATTQVFLYPPSFKLRQAAEEAGIERERHAFIIRNSRMDANWSAVQRGTLPIAARAIDSLIFTQGVGDLYRIALNAERDGIDFNLAYIPPSFKAVAKEAFDPEYMTKLFDVGFDLARQGYPWEKSPPGFDGALTDPSR